MIDSYFNSYKKLSLSDKREILLTEIKELLDVIEKTCKHKKVKIESLKSANYINNKKLLNEEDFYNLSFIYITYIKEDLACLLEKSTCK